MGRQADMDLLVRAASGGWTDSYVCQKTDEKGVKYPFHFRIYHAPDIDCIQSDMLRLSDRSYLGIESTLRLRHEPSTPL